VHFEDNEAGRRAAIQACGMSLHGPCVVRGVSLTVELSKNARRAMSLTHASTPRALPHSGPSPRFLPHSVSPALMPAAYHGQGPSPTNPYASPYIPTMLPTPVPAMNGTMYAAAPQYHQYPYPQYAQQQYAQQQYYAPYPYQYHQQLQLQQPVVYAQQGSDAQMYEEGPQQGGYPGAQYMGPMDAAVPPGYMMMVGAGGSGGHGDDGNDGGGVYHHDHDHDHGQQQE